MHPNFRRTGRDVQANTIQVRASMGQPRLLADSDKVIEQHIFHSYLWDH